MINETHASAERWFRRVLWIGILANLGLAIPTLLFPAQMMAFSRLPIAQPVSWAYPSHHQPSSTERFSAPFAAAFIPEVPDASRGRRGVLSQTSHPATR